MKIHYFQRYHGKENVATANTMLLLSRLYASSPNKFFQFFKSFFFTDAFEPEIIFNLQEKSKDSVPDATITQEGFKIIKKTKMGDWFNSEQLLNHLKAFSDEKSKVILTLAPELMNPKKLNEIKELLITYNAIQNYPVNHVNTTFEGFANAIREFIDDRDYEMQDVLNDFLDYCNDDNLIKSADSWKRMRMQLASATFEFNFSNDLYYNDYNRKFSPHNYLGLYKNKSVRAIGKINTIISRIISEEGVEYKSELGEITEERKQLIDEAIEDGKKYGYNMETANVRYFFVDRFYETDFKKTSPYAPMGTRFFFFFQILETEQLPETGNIAELLKTKFWS